MRSDGRPQGRIAVLSRHLASSKSTSDQELITAEARAQTVPRPGKVQTAEEAVRGIPDDATVTVGGFVGCGCPELLLQAVRQRFDASGQPRNMHLFNVATGGDGKGRGLDVLAAPGLVASLTYAWAGMSPKLLSLVRDHRLPAWNLPLGVVTHMLRDVAAKRPGPVTTIGLGTFVDPRDKGGKAWPDQQDKVELVRLGGREYLWYKVPPRIHVALLRGTTADLDGNISVEHEPIYKDELVQAMAAHNSGGVVIVQVERLVDRGSIPTRNVHIPGALVDKVVVAPPELHWQTFASPVCDGSLTGELRAPLSALRPLPLDERKIIAHRAMLEVDRPNMLVNLGVGMPEGFAAMVNSHSHHNEWAGSCTMSTEAGMWGGVPAAGLRFGGAVNATAQIPCASMMDVYQGGGIDLACLGMAEVDAEGNVNVSRFTGRTPGCGGFIDISQTAKKVLFLGTFMSGGLKVSLADGKLQILQEGRHRKFQQRVLEKTFASSSCKGRPVLYITERAVFRFHDGEGLELIEIAPGIDLERDVLQRMAFKPVMHNVKLMDPRIFVA
ncbi:hypothetical protein WJX72_009007 [[Myrmecia] bisecta]|uniref:Succinyl-CoA:3-ketoacid-coenzyme A transferase n=1 Tax=[Myrmecia] bisecta TaxID=41462 RepID=A0AAW1Q489_9CHLO